jgi:hypothetical protein
LDDVSYPPAVNVERRDAHGGEAIRAHSEECPAAQIPSPEGGALNGEGWSMHMFGADRALHGRDEQDRVRPVLDQRGANWPDLPQREDYGTAVLQPSVYMDAEVAATD